MLRKLFILGIIAIPFSAVPGIPLLGETQHELSTYVFLVAILLAIPSFLPTQKNDDHQVYLLPKIMMVAFFVISLSFLINASSILNSRFHEREGIEKFISSAMLVLYGFLLARLSYFLAKDEWYDLIIIPIAVSVGICVIFSVFEVLSWWPSLGGNFFSAISAFVHAGFGWENVGTRLRSVSFEPAAFANYAGFAWPWLFAGFTSRKGMERSIYLILWISLSIMIVLSSTRTGVIMLSGNILALLMLRYIFLPPKQDSILVSHMAFFPVAAMSLIAGIFLIGHFDDLVSSVVSGDNVSNISRLASNTAAFDMFLEHPFFGFGFGQYGFHMTSYMPSWGYYSREIVSWLTGPDNTKWPPVFSMYARFAAELGVVGVVIWTVFWFWLARNIWKTTLLYQKVAGLLPYPAYPLILSCLCVLLGGIPSDSLRPPMIWITLGLSCYYLRELRGYLASAVMIVPAAEARPDAMEAYGLTPKEAGMFRAFR